MKYICTILVALGIVYLSSCSSNDSSNTSTVTTRDSLSKGDFFTLSLSNASGPIDSFYLNDYSVNNVSVISLYANIMYVNTDSLWHLNLQLMDTKQAHAGVIFNGTSTTATGTYTSTTNTCTVIDYTNNQNVTYSVLPGSTVDITQSTYPIQGSFTFNLNHNYNSATATGSFKIFH